VVKLSEQIAFWSGEFGNEYISRNASPNLLASNLHLFATVLSHCPKMPKSFLEFGANIGMNYKAISLLSPGSNFLGVEVNHQA
jgi:spore coat polysaccharide biosynthesis protein SpsF